MHLSLENFPVGLEIDVCYPNLQVSLKLLSAAQLQFQIKEGPFARTELVDIKVVPLGNSLFAVSWQEQDGATVTNVQDVYYEPGLTVAEGDFVAIHGRIRGWSDAPQVVIDLFRIEGGRLAEHWDVLQDEILLTKAPGGVAMFDPDEGAHRA